MSAAEIRVRGEASSTPDIDSGSAAKAPRFGALLQSCGPLGPVIVPAFGLLFALSLSRVELCLVYRDRLRELSDAGTLFWIGSRIDASLLAYLTALPMLLLLGLPRRAVAYLRWPVVAYWTAIVGLVGFLELASIQFIDEFGLRPNRLFFEFLNHPREVFGTLWSEYGAILVLVFSVTGLALLGTAIVMNRLILHYRPWTARRRLIALAPALTLLFLFARGTLDHRPMNVSTAAFSNNQLANQLALNSTYSLLYALYNLRHENHPSDLYGTMPIDEMLSIVSDSAQIGADEMIPGGIPLLHRQSSHFPRDRPLNLVIVLEESLGAEFVGCLGGLPLTPNFDRLSEEGMLLRKLYATGSRTVRGIEAVVSGFLPTPGRSVVKLDLSQNNFFTLASLLQSHGYATEFIYGGQSHFDNMRAFFRNNGFQEIYDEPSFPAEGFHGTWGVSDEDLYLEADRIFRSHSGQPFFGLLLTTSNHSPFEFPEGRIELYEEPAATRHNAMKYADYALGRFLDLARQSDYYKDTIFLVVADHNAQTNGSELVPIHKFRIPGLILGPGVPRVKYDRVASQIDLASTVLDLMGLDVDHPMIGRSLVGPEEAQPNRAIMQFGENNAYRVGDQVIVLQPRLSPVQFSYVDERLVPATLDPAFAREALAHALLPGWLYRNRLHALQLPERGAVR